MLKLYRPTTTYLTRLAALVVLLLLAFAATSPTALACTTCTIVNETSNPPPNNNPGYKFTVAVNTDLGEGVMVELHDFTANTYTRTACTYLNGTNLPAGTTARFECNTPTTIPAGRSVEYQYAVCNYGTTGTNCHGYTGFQWSFTSYTPASTCAGAATGDNNVYYVGLGHSSFLTQYRSPSGPVTTGQGTITLKFRACQNDVQSVSLRVWNDRTNTESLLPMTFDSNGTDPTLGAVSYWTVSLPIPNSATALYYSFRAVDGTSTAYYSAKAPDAFYGGKTNPGGWGEARGTQSTAESNSFQVTVYDPAFDVPAWMQRGVVYQIFPDRFRDGDPANNPTAGRFSYNIAGGAIVRSNQTAWNVTVCDPRGVQTPSCPDKYGDNFYGGDLKGITQKVQQGYFDNLGVTVLYLNPIFRAPSNHKYDTSDYLTSDPDFGTLADFQTLAQTAHAHGIKIMLDGVFNHTSSDSKYFDRYHRYDAAGNLTSPGVGADDNSGACEDGASPYYGWFYFPDIGAPGKDGATTVYCANGAANAPQTYEAWYGYSSLPKLRANSTAVRSLIWSNGLASVGPYWTSQGADGWRFDVGGDVDPGVTNDPTNDYWEGFRAAVRNAGLTGKSDVVMLGEEWGDATPWLLGGEWDSVMNYRFRSAVMSWLFTGCTGGNGCNSGTSFEDNDANSASISGPMGYLSPSQFDTRLRSIAEDYPPMAFKAMMNLADSHDTNRVRFLLKKINNDSDVAAVQRLKEWWLFAFTYAGAPTLYYGDEVGLSMDGVASNGKYEDDPYNRTPYPWDDTPGDYSADTTNLLPFARKMASLRHSYRTLQDGDVQHGLIVDDANKVYGFGRTNGSQTALIALNRDSVQHTAIFSGLNAAPFNLPNGTILREVIEGATYTVSGGQVTVPVNPTWGVVLLEDTKVDTPAAPTGLQVTQAGANNVVSWNTVMTDTLSGRELVTPYRVYRGATSGFTPGPANLLTTVAPAAFGTANGKQSTTDTGAAGQGYYYKILAVNGTGQTSASVGSTTLHRAAVVRGNVWYLRNSLTSGLSDLAFTYGLSTDTPLMCDWDGNGTRTPGVFRNGAWLIKNTASGGAADLTFNYGLSGDTPLCGDWDGNGTETVGVKRGNVWYLRNTNSSGVSDLTIAYGLSGDTGVVGDWNGDGIDTPGVARTSGGSIAWYLRNTNTNGPADLVFLYGATSDVPTSGDWDANGTDTPGVFRNGTWFLRNTNDSGPGETFVTYGVSGDAPRVWR